MSCINVHIVSYAEENIYPKMVVVVQGYLNY